METPRNTRKNDAEDYRFWLAASWPSLKAIWDNDEDNIYADLVEPETDAPRRRRTPNTDGSCRAE